MQTKSLGSSLRLDLETALRAAQVEVNASVFSSIQCFVKDKKIKDLSFKPLKNALLTFLLPEEVYKKHFFIFKDTMMAYEDDALAIVDKPPGLSTQGTHKVGEDHLYGAMMAYYTKNHGNKLAYVGLHHRLDRDTSGLVLFTKKSSANKSIAEQFQDHKIKKKYHAVVVGTKPTKEEWMCEESIIRDHSSDKIFRFKTSAKGDSARTHFRWLKEISPGQQLIECVPYTGRTHQIRVHLHFCGWPILGDRTYGRHPHIRMMLHATELTLLHPITLAPLTVRSKNDL